MKKLLCLILLLALQAPALAMTESRAIELVKLADDRALGAREFWVSPSGEADGAWVFYATSGKDAYFNGVFWYVDETQAVRLGASDTVFSWELMGTDPEIYASLVGDGSARHANACALVDGAPVIIEDARALRTLDWPGHGNALYTLGSKSLEYVFLRLDRLSLVEIAAIEITQEEFLTLPGAEDLLDELGAEGWMPTEFLYRSTGVIAINVTNSDGAIRRLYVWFDDAKPMAEYEPNPENDWLTEIEREEGGEGALYPNRGWEEELVLISGAAKRRYKIGLPIVESDPFVPDDA